MNINKFFGIKEKLPALLLTTTLEIDTIYGEVYLLTATHPIDTIKGKLLFKLAYKDKQLAEVAEVMLISLYEAASTEEREYLIKDNFIVDSNIKRKIWLREKKHNKKVLDVDIKEFD